MSKRGTIIIHIAGVLLQLFSFYCNGQLANNNWIRPNIVWITCEDMSLHLSCFGETQIQTPNLDALAKDGIKYTNVYTCAGVCAPSRNGIITGMYPQSIGGDNMRNYQPGNNGLIPDLSKQLTSYSIVPPPFVKCFPEYLRKELYYCTNNPKEDYQFEAPVTVWDESSKKAHYRNRPDGRPFFAVFNLEVTHESQLWKRDSLPLEVDPAKVSVPPYYPDNAETRRAIAMQLSNVLEMDRQAGKIIQGLKESGLYDNTIIFFYSYHGDGLPFVKREITKRGIHIPLIIKLAGQSDAGKTEKRLISTIDFGPTVLSLTGIPVPAYIHGKAFLGAQQQAERKYVFAARDRMDVEVDKVRSVFDGRFQYIRNYMPQQPWYQNIIYRLNIPMMKKMLALKEAGKLNAIQMRWFNVKPVEELYDTKIDPYQFNNLAANPAFKSKLNKLKLVYNNWMIETGDLHALPELELRNKMWGNTKEAPITATPELLKFDEGYIIRSATPGASIGYEITSSKNTNRMNDHSWKVYNHCFLTLKEGEKITIRAQRIGFIASQIEFEKPDANRTR